MELKDLIIPTALARPGMAVREVIAECVRANVPGIPFMDAQGRITGKASIRHILKETCIPDFMIRHSHLLGDQIHHLNITRERLHQLLAYDIDPFVLPQMAVANASTPIAKALAIMEDQDTTYLFVVDQGEYRGVISVMGIGQMMLEPD